MFVLMMKGEDTTKMKEYHSLHRERADASYIYLHLTYHAHNCEH